MSETVTRYPCAETGYLHDGRCHADPDRTEECACEARVFEVVREPGRTPRLVDPNESGRPTDATAGAHDPDPGRSR